jgi:hypothetical protein
LAGIFLEIINNLEEFSSECVEKFSEKSSIKDRDTEEYFD